MVWGFFESNGIPIKPLKYSNGKSQDQIVDELLDLRGLIFLWGNVGTGKSIIAATLCKALGRGIIVVPVKALQEQYERDYALGRYISLDGSKATISQDKGRANFECLLMGGLASRRDLPCTRKLERHESRWNVASICQYWSPIYPEPRDMSAIEYESIDGPKYYHKRARACGYYEQFAGYVDSDIIVMNLAKWQLETYLNRKPKVDVEVIDEGDLFLSNLASKLTIGKLAIDRLSNLGLDMRREFQELLNNSLEPIDFLRHLENELNKVDHDYVVDLQSRVKQILEHEDHVETMVSSQSISYFIPYPEVVLKRILASCAERVVLMSATIPRKSILKDVYQVEPRFVEAETRFPGVIFQELTGLEQKITYKTWASKKVKERYWQCLAKILERASRPCLVNVHAYEYLPLERIGLIPSQGEVRENQDDEIKSFVAMEKDLVFTTKLDRGIDLPFEKCNSIVIMKYPYPLKSDVLIQAMGKRLSKEVFHNYYEDLADREFLQSIGRALRAPNDSVEFWSPDLKCHARLKKVWRGDII